MSNDKERKRRRFLRALNGKPRGYLAALARRIEIAPQAMSMWKKKDGPWPDMVNEAKLWRALERDEALATRIDKDELLAVMRTIRGLVTQVEEALADVDDRAVRPADSGDSDT